MLSLHILALAFALAPPLVSAAIFPPDSLVKVIDAKGFKKAMKANETSLVAFVAPWCGHCQKMAPEYSKAALGLYPLVPAYAVDCDAAKNKQLCAEQGVQGFPTIKLFPRGNKMAPVLYTSERTSSGFWYFATGGVPQAFTRLLNDFDVSPWAEKHQTKHRALLLKKNKKTPLLWKVLANKYQGQLEFAGHYDKKGKTSIQLGLEAGEKKESKVLLYPAGSTNFIRYEGIQKLDSLSKFLDSVLNGTADLSSIIEETKAEEIVIDEKELEIERKQEAQRIALLHGGFTDLIDFEKALLNGGADYHGSHGYGGGMGGIPEHLKKQSKAGTPAATTITTTTATNDAITATAASITSTKTKGQTATPQKEDGAAPKPITTSEPIKVVEDKKEEEEIEEQVILGVNDAEASPVSCQGKSDAQSELGQDGGQPTTHPKDEL